MKKILLHICCGPCSLMPIRELLAEGFQVTGYFFNPNIHLQDEYDLRLAAARQAAKNYGIDFITAPVPDFYHDPEKERAAGPEIRNLLNQPEFSAYTPYLCQLWETNAAASDILASQTSPDSSTPQPEIRPLAETVNPLVWLHGLQGEFREKDRCRYCYGERITQAAQFAAQNGFDAFSSSLLYSKYQAHEDICVKATEAANTYGTKFLYRDWRPFWQAGIDLSKDWGLYRQKWCGCALSRAERMLWVAAKEARKKARETAGGGEGNGIK